MDFIEDKVVEVVRDAWSWKIPGVSSVLAVNSMGNCFVQDANNHYWRICPEELSASRVATNEIELAAIFNDPDTKADWQLLGLIDPAEKELGLLELGQCYVMVIPAIIGGDYAISNLRVGCLYEYLTVTGNLAFQAKDLKQGDEVKIEIAL